MVVGTPKGRDTKQNVRRNVGFPRLVVQELAGDETFGHSAISENQNACDRVLERPVTAVEAPVEVFQRFQTAEISGLGAAFHQPLLADIDFVLADQFQELGVAQPVGDGFLQTHVQGLQQTRETELFQGVFKIAHILILG